VIPTTPTLKKEPRPTGVPPADITLDAEAFKKNLLTKMWKYMHDDERPAKAV
jgi:hypothetical protein